jgi:hypothetical protein
MDRWFGVAGNAAFMLVTEVLVVVDMVIISYSTSSVVDY